MGTREEGLGSRIAEMEVTSLVDVLLEITSNTGRFDQNQRMGGGHCCASVQPISFFHIGRYHYAQINPIL